jgi:Domain of unknown function (DUF1996)
MRASPARSRPLLRRYVSVRVSALLLVGALVTSGCQPEQRWKPGDPSRWTEPRLPSVAFVVTCALSHELYDDPLVHPGQAGASHHHAFFGNETTNADSTQQSLNAGKTTCNDPLDRAAYWTPGPAGDTLRAYYDAGKADPALLVSFRQGQVGLAGSPYTKTPGSGVVAFRCGAPADGPDAAGWSNSLPAGGCSAGTVPTVRYSFGQCGGARLLSCAANERPQYVRLRLVLEWRGSLNGTIHGMGAHADFWNAWDPSRLEELVAVCVRGERRSNLEIKQCRLPGSG